MDGAAAALSAFLKARRAMLTPEQVGLAGGGRRQVPGLRREEVARLAGISPDYLMRLEQGRGHHPSDQVLSSLAASLRLDGAATAHLRRLAHGAQVRTTRPERVQQGILHLLESVDGRVSAFVQSRFLDVLAANKLATALCPSFVAGANVLREAFFSPEIRALYPDWPVVVREATAGLRAASGSHLESPRFVELVSELSRNSPEFRELWARHEVRPRLSGQRRFHHPLVGPLDLHHEKLAIPGSDGQLLIFHHPEPDTDSAAAFARLAVEIR